MKRGGALTRHAGANPYSTFKSPPVPLPRTEWLSRSGGAKPRPNPGRSRNQHPRDTGFSAAVRLVARTRAGNGDPDEARCEACSVWLGRFGGQIQHRLARRAGGSRNDPEVGSVANAAVLCGTSADGDHGRAERREREMGPDGAGFWLRTGQRPSAEPILLAGVGGGVKVWLTADGGYSASAPGVAS